MNFRVNFFSFIQSWINFRNRMMNEKQYLKANWYKLEAKKNKCRDSCLTCPQKFLSSFFLLTLAHKYDDDDVHCNVLEISWNCKEKTERECDTINIIIVFVVVIVVCWEKDMSFVYRWMNTTHTYSYGGRQYMDVYIIRVVKK